MVEVPECESKTQYLEADAAANAVAGQSPCRQDTRVWVTKEKVEKLDSPRFTVLCVEEYHEEIKDSLLKFKNINICLEKILS